MTDMRRTLLWVVFLMSLTLLWDGWNKHNGQPSMFSPAPAARPAASAAPGASTTSPTPPQASTVAPSAATAASAPAAGLPAEKVTVTTDLVKATFDSTGGALVRLELLQQQEQNQADIVDRVMGYFKGSADKPDPKAAKQNVILFDQSSERYYVAQTGLWPSTGGPGALPEHHTVMRVVPGERELKEGAKELKLAFESPEVNGVKLIKTYTFKRGDYAIGVTHEVVNGSAAALSPRLYLQLVRDGNPPPGGSFFYGTFTGPAVYTEANKFQKVEFKDLNKGKAVKESADNGWVAMLQHYFASAWLVGGKQARDIYADKVPGTANEFAVGMFLPLGEIAAGASKSVEAQLFAGPQEDKKLKSLADVAPDFDLVRDYGIFTILAKPLFWLLSQLHALLGNWGWAIVALVVLLRIAFYWLNVSAYRSMAKMKAINPRVMELRERLKDKPQQMQQEMMRIYREEKVNPLGGCLPILVQMPFFIALYSVLLASVEMRNAPWVGWITDLSVKDPYFILPLLMTASSLLQTWLNPTPPDPVQARMMWIMPLVFSVMFFGFPAGLVLYWLTNNILAIAQQWVINKQLGVLGK
ncbi:MAG TPA: membrane protein insertase YidC [Rhizobacter sp.]|nr:membrane protein insertase YidC [Rhizobacter sp.]